MLRYLVVLVALSACAASRTAGAGAGPAPQQTASGDDVVCRMERVVGSRFKKQVCSTARGRARGQDAAQEVIRKARPEAAAGF